MRSRTSALLPGSLVALGADSTAAIRSSFQKNESPGRDPPEATSPQRLPAVYTASRWEGYVPAPNDTAPALAIQVKATGSSRPARTEGSSDAIRRASSRPTL